MSESRNVSINRLPSGVGKLDAILGGGWPEYSFNLIVGEPGRGKTTLAHQFFNSPSWQSTRAFLVTVTIYITRSKGSALRCLHVTDRHHPRTHAMQLRPARVVPVLPQAGRAETDHH